MAKPNLTSEAILEAIAKFDELGRDEFLDTYGFRPARRYFLVHEGRYYDCKAIAGVAHGFGNPADGPMSQDEFSGGEATVKKWL